MKKYAENRPERNREQTNHQKKVYYQENKKEIREKQKEYYDRTNGRLGEEG
jgi:hypothetical protein